jgi:hypothetical protein
MICNKCNGRGTTPNNKYIVVPFLSVRFCCCTKCYGLGEIDWLENIIGVDPNKLFFSMPEGVQRKTTKK